MIKVKDRSFISYIEDNPNELTKTQMERIFEDIDNPRGSTMYDETFDFMQWLHGRPGRQELFYEYIKKNYTNFFGKRVLEVGCGPRARLSKMLSRSFKMTAMDPSLDPDLRIKHVKLIRKIFKYNTPIDNFDLVIGLEPCDATEEIIRNCLTNNKEFIVVLCGTPHKCMQDGITPKSAFEWYKYLLEIDPNYLQFRKLELNEFTAYAIMNKRDN